MRPFAQRFEDSVSALGEKALIRRILNIMGQSARPSPEGPGDDCAAIPLANFKKENLLVTSDAVILGRHFDAATAPALAGAKLLKRNVSDIAAMGGRPLYAQTSAVVSKNLSADWLFEFCRGLTQSARLYNVHFSGGDIASVEGEYFSMHLALFGECDAPLTRASASVGDILCVTGALGGSLKSGRHLTFEPRIKEGAFLAASGVVSACMDISDGLAGDLPHLIAPHCMAVLEPACVPRAELYGGCVSFESAMQDGEDYELLFAVRADADIEALKDAYLKKFGRLFFVIGGIKKAPSPEDECAVFLNHGGVLIRLGLKGFSH